MQGSFAELLRRYRGASGLTQEGLAERAALSVEAIGSLEAARRLRPRPVTVKALADALGLSGDDRELFEAAARRPGTGTVRLAMVRQLPPGINDFSGRESEVRALTEVVTRAVDPVWSPAVVVAAVTGMGGIGKTALALHVAHQVTEAFPDGQLYLDLRGFGPGEPMRPIEALDILLRALGAAEADLPADPDHAAGRYRSALAGRRFLVVLDNAADTAQVTPLLPGVAGSAAVVTSRRVLVDLPVVQHLSLGPLADDEAVDLLARIIGAARVSAEPAAALEVVRSCGRLPLAVRIAAARLATRPGWTVADLADRLGRETRRLDELTGDNRGVRASFAVSLAELAQSSDQIDTTAAEVFPLLALPGSPDLTARVVTRLCELPPELTERALERLADVHLLESVRPGRYRLHDLLRLFAQEQAAEALTAADRAAALSRILDLYVAMAWRADELAGTMPMRAEVLRPGWTDQAADVTDLQVALDWLDDERANIVAAVRRGAAGSARDRTTALRLAVGFNALGVLRRRWSEWREVNLAALEPARSAADPVPLGLVHLDLGLSSGEVGDYPAAARHFRAAVEVAARMRPSTEHDRFRDRCLMHLCHALERLGEYDEGIRRGLEVLERTVASGDRELEAWTRLTLGMLSGRTGQVERQHAMYDAALELIEALGNDRATAMFRLNIGMTQREAGRPDAAVPQLLRCLELYRQSGSVSGEAEALDELAMAHLQLDDPELALEYQRRGLALAEEVDAVLRQASIRHRMGLALLASGRADEAATQWDVALEIYRRHGSPVADELRRLLDGQVSARQS